MSVSELLSSIPSADALGELTMPGWGFLLLIFALMAIPMGPAEPTVLVAGAAAEAFGAPLWLTSVVVAAGMALGDLLTFLSAGALRRRLLRRGTARATLCRWESRIRSQPIWRDAAVAGLRFLPGARTPVALAARGRGISTVRFCALTAGGASVWALVWAGTASVAENIPPAWLLILGAVAVLVLLLARGRTPAQRCAESTAAFPKP